MTDAKVILSGNVIEKMGADKVKWWLLDKNKCVCIIDVDLSLAAQVGYQKLIDQALTQVRTVLEPPNQVGISRVVVER